MPDTLRSKIIRMAHTHADLRPHLLRLLVAGAVPVLDLDWDGKEVAAWKKWRVWQHIKLLLQAKFQPAAWGSGYQLGRGVDLIVLNPVKTEAAALAAANAAVTAYTKADPYGGIANVSGIIRWHGSGEGTFSGVYSTFHSDT